MPTFSPCRMYPSSAVAFDYLLRPLNQFDHIMICYDMPSNVTMFYWKVFIMKFDFIIDDIWWHFMTWFFVTKPCRLSYVMTCHDTIFCCIPVPQLQRESMNSGQVWSSGNHWVARQKRLQSPQRLLLQQQKLPRKPQPLRNLEQQLPINLEPQPPTIPDPQPPRLNPEPRPLLNLRLQRQLRPPWPSLQIRGMRSQQSLMKWP